MTETQMLIGSLSNDLLRVATMIQRGSNKGAVRFFAEAKKWSSQLKHRNIKSYIRKLVNEIDADTTEKNFNLEKAERYLMYSILLQNYALHN